MANGDGNKLNTGILYKPASLDLSGIGDDIEQIGKQMVSYQQEKKRYQQRRKDMMWQRAMKIYDVKPPEAVMQNNQKLLNGMYNDMLKKLEPLADRIDGDEDDYEALQKMREITSQYKSKANEVHSWYKQYQTDKQIAYNNSEDIDEESRRNILEYSGGKPYKGEIKFKPKDPNQVFTQLGELMKEGNTLELIDQMHLNSAGEVMQIKETVKNGKNPFWKKNEETGEWEPTALQRRIIKAKVAEPLVAQGLIEELRRFGKLVDKERGIYKVGEELYSVDISGKKTTEDGRSVKNLVDFTAKHHRHQVFSKDQTEIRTTTTQAGEEESEGELTQSEKKKMLFARKGANKEKIGKYTLDSYYDTGALNIHGTSSLGKAKEATTGKTVNFKDMDVDWNLVGVDPYKNKFVVSIQGYRSKVGPKGEELAPTSMTEQMRKQMFGESGSKTLRGKRFIIDATEKSEWLGGRLSGYKFINPETNEIILQGGQGQEKAKFEQPY